MIQEAEEVGELSESTVERPQILINYLQEIFYLLDWFGGEKIAVRQSDEANRHLSGSLVCRASAGVHGGVWLVES